MRDEYRAWSRAARTLASGGLALAAVGGASAWGTGATRQPTPPARMSTEGGALLGSPGVRSAAGAPALPGGLSALSFAVSDLGTGDVLAAKNAHWPLPPASTLKMLFADTVLPKFAPSLVHKVTARDLDGMGEGSSEVGVVPGQSYKVADLWLGVFLRSGNDAVHTLAAMNGGVAATVREMQEEARALGADDTRVVTPDGYDEPGQVSSAYDLSLFARAGLADPDFARYCGTVRTEFPGGPQTKGRPFEIDNTNRLLSGIYGVSPYPGVIGVKNGYTTDAGNTLAVAARRGGRTVLVTVMHPEEKRPNEIYREARALLDWGFAADGKGTPIGTLDPPRPAGGESAGASAASGGSAAQAAGLVHRRSPGTAGWLLAGAVALVAGGAALLLLRRRRS